MGPRAASGGGAWRRRAAAVFCLRNLPALFRENTPAARARFFDFLRHLPSTPPSRTSHFQQPPGPILSRCSADSTNLNTIPSLLACFPHCRLYCNDTDQTPPLPYLPQLDLLLHLNNLHFVHTYPWTSPFPALPSPCTDLHLSLCFSPLLLAYNIHPQHF